ncbi:ABC transporter permease, partial [Mycobacteroides abscessus subsp. massiliense]|nr:ABC transporter permease [Mycobacteroides abscessus subsp. massiliense]
DGQSRFASTPRLVIVPALFLSAAVLGFIMVGDALRDALDPRRR